MVYQNNHHIATVCITNSGDKGAGGQRGDPGPRGLVGMLVTSIW